MPLHAAFDLAALRSSIGPAPATHRSTARAAVTAAVIAITLVLAIGATGALAATTVTPKCDATNPPAAGPMLTGRVRTEGRVGGPPIVARP